MVGSQNGQKDLFVEKQRVMAKHRKIYIIIRLGHKRMPASRLSNGEASRTEMNTCVAYIRVSKSATHTRNQSRTAN
jgi:hypothetical protein